VKVHHLNCGTEMLPGTHLVSHVLLIETPNGLTLVDTGFGTRDCDDPRRRLGPVRHFSRPPLRHDETAVYQVERLGFRPDDVRHIVITHFDSDHIGGLSDFPSASVHLTSAEALGAVHAPSRREQIRFRRAQWAHAPKLVEHSPTGEAWHGFAGAKPLTEIDPGVVLVPMPGHTRGHAAVAVDAGHRWILHAGDAFYHPGTLDGSAKVPFALRALESLVAFDRKQVRANHDRLAELYLRRDPGLLVVCSHDRAIFTHARDTA
jgi:glyoxylase-like metal-dependent hydrolase (beta-lactamase superfamily II)